MAKSNFLHVGTATLNEIQVATKSCIFPIINYNCCIEFPYPIDEVINGILVKTLPGGLYTILRMVKDPAVIARSIRQFTGDYIPDNEIILDQTRPVYEIYYDDEMEYCVPVLD